MNLVLTEKQAMETAARRDRIEASPGWAEEVSEMIGTSIKRTRKQELMKEGQRHHARGKGEIVHSHREELFLRLAHSKERHAAMTASRVKQCYETNRMIDIQ